MKRSAILILAVGVAGLVGLGTLSATTTAAATPHPTILCPPAC